MSSVSRRDSILSSDSIGIGVGTSGIRSEAHQPIIDANQQQQQQTCSDLTLIGEDVRISDCIVYLMYCFTHHKIALAKVFQNNNNKLVWLPFVLVKDGTTWEQTARDGVAMWLSEKMKDEEIDVKTGKLPKMEISQFQFLRIQMPNERYYFRYAHFVHIEKGEDDSIACCDDSASLLWVATSDIFQDQIENLWGPEVKEFTKMLVDDHSTKYIHEQTFDDILKILNDENFARLLVNQQIDSNILQAVYEEYIEHCFPSMFMSLHSFKSFMVRFGGYARNIDDSQVINLFNAFGYKHNGSYIDFDEFLIGLACMEPKAESYEPNRLRMIFRYFNVDKHQKDISFKEMIQLLNFNDANYPEQSKKALENKISIKDGRITFSQFEQAVQNNLIRGIDKICRSSKSIIQQICLAIKSKSEQQSSKHPKTREIKMKDRGICNGCRGQKYEYAVHCVSFDVNGRCVKPLRLCDVRIEGTITPVRYSAELVFGMNTMCRNIMDIVRNSYQKNESFMTEESAITAFRTFRTLCGIVSQLLMCEEKIHKVQSPTLVIGSISGKIESLMSLEKIFWLNIPVLTTNLIFLGNYTGPAKNNIEVLCYLFALKISSPNKVFLLRGFNETMDNSKELQTECIYKYGPENGKLIWQEFNKVFNRLPLCCIVDEQIFCVHSGIPRNVTNLSMFATIPDNLANVPKESPLAYDLISNVPNPMDKSLNNGQIIDSSTKKINGKTSEFNFHSFYNFMQNNNLNFMIRSRELSPIPNGYQFYFDRRCLTITSALDRFSIVAEIAEEIKPICINHLQRKSNSKANNFD